MAKDDQLYAVISLVRPVFRALVAAVEDRLAGTRLGVPERGVLEWFHALGPLTVPGLARAIGVPRQFVQRTCNGLLASGLIVRGANPAHARSGLITLTPAARVLQAMRDHDERLPGLHA